MSHSSAVVHLFHTHADADQAVLALSKTGFDMQKLSLLGKGYHSEEKPVGFYTAGDRIKAWGGTGAFWGGIWGLLLAPAVFVLPGVGVVAMAGPFVAALVGALEGAVVVGSLTALGAALTQLGVPKAQVIKYEAAIKVDGFLLVVHGSAEEQSQARRILSAMTPAAALPLAMPTAVNALVPAGPLVQLEPTLAAG